MEKSLNIQFYCGNNEINTKSFSKDIKKDIVDLIIFEELEFYYGCIKKHSAKVTIKDDNS